MVQAGADGEHRFGQASAGSAQPTVDRPHVRVRLEPGCGERIVFDQARYAEQARSRSPGTAPSRTGSPSVGFAY